MLGMGGQLGCFLCAPSSWCVVTNLRFIQFFSFPHTEKSETEVVFRS